MKPHAREILLGPRPDCRPIAPRLNWLRHNDPNRYIMAGCGLRYLRDNVRAWWSSLHRPGDVWCGTLNYFGVSLGFVYGIFEEAEVLSVHTLAPAHRRRHIPSPVHWDIVVPVRVLGSYDPLCDMRVTSVA